jgi:hypothetical protein
MLKLFGEAPAFCGNKLCIIFCVCDSAIKMHSQFNKISCQQLLEVEKNISTSVWRKQPNICAPSSSRWFAGLGLIVKV